MEVWVGGDGGCAHMSSYIEKNISRMLWLRQYAKRCDAKPPWLLKNVRGRLDTNTNSWPLLPGYYLTHIIVIENHNVETQWELVKTKMKQNSKDKLLTLNNGTTYTQKLGTEKEM
jgi:hypothetical protein